MTRLRNFLSLLVFYLGLLLALLFLAYTFMPLAHAQTARTATITYTRPTQYTDGTTLGASVAVSYKVYAGAKGSTNKTVIGTVTTTATTINTGLPPGETCFQVSAIANGAESALSNEACKTFPFPAPETVTITVT